MKTNPFKKVLSILTSRMIIVGCGVFLQVIWFVLLLFLFKRTGVFASILLDILAFAFAIYIINRKVNTSYNLCWVFLVLGFPFIGLVVFTLNGQWGKKKKNVQALNRLYSGMEEVRYNDKVELDNIRIENKQIASQFNYLSQRGGYPVYSNTKCKYFKSGEEMYPSMLEDLKNAKKYIFFEFFIIDEGEFWNSILEIMKQKVEEGVEVRVIYDDMGTIQKIPFNYYKKIRKMGIPCMVFNRFRVGATSLSTTNNRDHRKILSIDGTIGYTGGVNIADEYINKIELFGYWKDSGVRLEGAAVKTLTNLFLASWGYCNNIEIDYTKYQPVLKSLPSDGYVAPYAGTPFLPENVAENVYLNLISRATDYVYIFTPYIALDGEMTSALINAAKSGIDVKIIVPGIPDKKSIYLLTQTYFKQLMDGGVEIYLYKPGFIHSKSIVVDDKICTVGSVNLDYRSLYLHFENGVLFYNSSVVMDVKKDFLGALLESELDTPEALKERTKSLTLFVQALLRLVAPML